MTLIKNLDASIVLIPQTAQDHNFLSYFCEMVTARNTVVVNDLGSDSASIHELPAMDIPKGTHFDD